MLEARETIAKERTEYHDRIAWLVGDGKKKEKEVTRLREGIREIESDTEKVCDVLALVGNDTLTHSIRGGWMGIRQRLTDLLKETK